MPKAPHLSLKQSDAYCLLSILTVNLLSLFIHNHLLPWIYLALGAGYYLLHGEIQKKNRIDYTAGVRNVLFPEKISGAFYWHWFYFAYAPLLFSLYYLDFALLWAGFFLNSIAVFWILKKFFS